MLATSMPFVVSAEAAYIADIPHRDLDRLVDEHIIPEQLVQVSTGRRIARLAAALIPFYVEEDGIFKAGWKRQVLFAVVERVRESGQLDAALSLDIANSTADYSALFCFKAEVGNTSILIDLNKYLQVAISRARRVDAALQAVSTDEKIINGSPVFRGTRVPIDTVLCSLARGVDFTRLQASYPFLTEALIDSASVYAQIRPRRIAPQQLSDAHPSWMLKYKKTVRIASS